MSTRFPVENIGAPAVNLTDYSGQTAAGQSIQIMPANPAARLYRLQNLSDSVSLWFNDTGAPAAAKAAGSYELVPGAYYEFSSPCAVSVYADAAITFSAARY